MQDPNVEWGQDRVSVADRTFEQKIFPVIIYQEWESEMLLTLVRRDIAPGMICHILGGTPCTWLNSTGAKNHRPRRTLSTP
jgi:hypothetical protein